MSENLLNLVNIIRDRKNKDEDKSYTSSLISGGLSKCIDKMEEEFGELKEALNDKSNVVHEAADTIYHHPGIVPGGSDERGGGGGIVGIGAVGDGIWINHQATTTNGDLAITISYYEIPT